MKYRITDSNQIMEELELRAELLKYESEDIINNAKAYMNKELDLHSQLKCIDTAQNGTIEEVIYMLETNWNVPIEPIREIEKEIIKALLLYKEDLNSLCGRLQADYNGDKEFEQMEEDRLGLCYIME